MSYFLLPQSSFLQLSSAYIYICSSVKSHNPQLTEFPCSVIQFGPAAGVQQNGVAERAIGVVKDDEYEWFLKTTLVEEVDRILAIIWNRLFLLMFFLRLGLRPILAFMNRRNFRRSSILAHDGHPGAESSACWLDKVESISKKMIGSRFCRPSGRLSWIH